MASAFVGEMITEVSGIYLAGSWADRGEICSCVDVHRWCWQGDTSSQPGYRWWSTSSPHWSHIHPLASPPWFWYLNGCVVECVNGWTTAWMSLTCMNNQRNTVSRFNAEAFGLKLAYYSVIIKVLIQNNLCQKVIKIQPVWHNQHVFLHFRQKIIWSISTKLMIKLFYFWLFFYFCSSSGTKWKIQWSEDDEETYLRHQSLPRLHWLRDRPLHPLL